MNIQQMPKGYMTKDNLTYSCQYCIMFCPKYRRKVFSNEMQERMKEVFTETADEFGFEILDMDIKSDCVRLIISCDPEFGVMNCIRRLKGRSSKVLKTEFPELKSRLPSLWTRSSFISSVGVVSLEEIENFYEMQKGR